MYTIYTDGSYKPTRDAGGYASVILNDDKVEKVLAQGYVHTTNNRMELLGLLSALKYFEEPKDLQIYSDSSYVVTSINKNHYKKWLEENDVTKKNLDLWDEIADWLAFHNVKMHWVKGHNDDTYNEMADLYANMAAIVLNPFTDLSDGTEKN